MHTYLSTSCLHGYHERCESKGAKCKFCEAKCVCSCHEKKEGRRRYVVNKLLWFVEGALEGDSSTHKHTFKLYGDDPRDKYSFLFHCECGRRCVFNKTALRYLVAGR